MITIDDIKESVSIEMILRRHAVPVFNGEWIICPFHRDTHPSIKIYFNTNTFYCFVCHKSGDIIDLVQALDNCDRKTAINKIITEFELVDKSQNIEANLKRLREIEKQKYLRKKYKYELKCLTQKQNIYIKLRLILQDIQIDAIKKKKIKENYNIDLYDYEYDVLIQSEELIRLCDMEIEKFDKEIYEYDDRLGNLRKHRFVRGKKRGNQKKT